MARLFPPEDLPDGYLPVWEALAQADRFAASRQILATDLGVATYTLQRILVDGNVPRFPETTSPRIVHAWVRTLTRLAIRFGAEPREWIEGIGIEWSHPIRSIVESTAHRIGRAPERSLGRRPTPTKDRLTRAIERTSGLPETVRLGIADLPPFSGLLPGFPEPFLTRYGARLVHAIDPSAALEIETGSEATLLSRLETTDPEIDLAVGVLETLPRRGRGHGFVPLPGWRIRLRAIGIARAGQGETMRWNEAISPIGVHFHDFLVPNGNVAYDYLIGQCGVPQRSVTVAPTERIEELAALVRPDHEAAQAKPLVFVADEPTVRRLFRDLDAKRTEGDERVPVWLEGEADEFPSYPLAITWSKSLEDSAELLSDAIRSELFGSSIIQTAFLYASLITVGFLRGTSRTWGGGELSIPSWRPEPFEEESPAFLRTLCRQVAITLNEGLTARYALRGTVGPPDALHDATFGEIGRNLDRLVPKAWQPTLVSELNRLAERSRLLRPSETPGARLPYCHSCSALLFDGIHGGVSDRYCRFCADESGNLRTRPEVEQLLSGWIGAWEGGVPEDEAARGASALMSQMPAWGAN